MIQPKLQHQPSSANMYNQPASSQHESPPPVVPGLTYESYTLVRYPQMQVPLVSGYSNDMSAPPSRYPASDSGYMSHANGLGQPMGSMQQAPSYAVAGAYPMMKSSYGSVPPAQSYGYMNAAGSDLKQQPAYATPPTTVKPEYAQQHPYLFQGARCELPDAFKSHQPQALADDSKNTGPPSTAIKRHFCCYCGKGFVRPSALQTHIYSHTGEKPFVCKEAKCNKAFSVVSNLRRHMKIHEKM